MAPPSMSYPRPVEMDPSFSRHWNSSLWKSTNQSLPSELSEQSISLNRRISSVRPMQTPVGLSSHTPQDSLASWYTNNDGPWIPKHALVEAAPFDAKSQPRSHPLGYHSVANQKFRTGRFPFEGASIDGSVMHGKSQSDSGYGSLPSMDTSSIRSYEIANHAAESQGFFRQDHDLQQVDTRSVHPMGDVETTYTGIPLTDPGVLRCPTCGTLVKTRSEMKYDLSNQM